MMKNDFFKLIVELKKHFFDKNVQFNKPLRRKFYKKKFRFGKYKNKKT